VFGDIPASLLKTVHERQELVDEPLRTETFDVRRIPINRPINGPVEVRQEGETTVYPVVEEVLVMTKQLMLREEIHVTRRVAEVHHPQIVNLSSDEIKIEREPAPGRDL
jgi:stress response protein YsnF